MRWVEANFATPVDGSNVPVALIESAIRGGFPKSLSAFSRFAPQPFAWISYAWVRMPRSRTACQTLPVCEKLPRSPEDGFPLTSWNV
jgi:hypothetical protein